MEVVHISSLQPGRRFGQAVFNRDGQLLCPSGEAVTRQHIVALKRCGVTSVVLEPLPEQIVSGQSPSVENMLETVRNAIHDRFRLHDLEDPRIRIIFDLAVERQSRIVLKQGGKAALGHKPAPAFQTQRPPKVNVKTLLGASLRMGTMPTVFYRLLEMLNNPNITSKELAKVIALDQALSARLLKLVNSPFYGMACKIDTISRAVTMVGTRQLVVLGMGATLVSIFRGLPVSLVNMRSFWAHSISCGAATRLLAKHANLPEAESFFVAGLLHDIARLIIYTELPNHSLHMLTEAKRTGNSLHTMEHETLGFTHEKFGSLMLRSWNCPDILVRRVGTHHYPITQNSRAEDVILPVADMLSHALGYGTSGEAFVPPVNTCAWDILGINQEAATDICAQFVEHVRELRTLFDN